MIMRFFLPVVLSIYILQVCNCQDTDQHTARLMFWNAENVFDIYDDTLTLDDDFLPSGVMRWNLKRYNRKISDIYKTIITAGEWSPPEIIAFCEIENKSVLEDLVHGTYLSRYDYGIIHEDSPDERGIDVCLIYRKDRVRIIRSVYLIPRGVRQSNFDTRSVLNACVGIGKDTLHLFINHWPSRRGGVLAGEGLRSTIALMIRQLTDSIISQNINSKIIIAGDFNCTPEDTEISLLTGREDSAFLINLSGIKESGEGTYRYLGTWEMIDQVIVSKGLVKADDGLSVKKSSMKIFSPGFLMTRDARYPGLSPFSMYRGYRYQGGVSDHLPVLLDLYEKPPEQQE